MKQRSLNFDYLKRFAGTTKELRLPEDFLEYAEGYLRNMSEEDWFTLDPLAQMFFAMMSETCPDEETEVKPSKSVKESTFLKELRKA